MDIDDAILMDRLRRDGPRVIVKRRRHAEAPAGSARAEGTPGGPETGEKKPRVFQLRARPETGAEAAAGAGTAPPAAEVPAAGEAPRPLRRARRDPTHAPGAVTRIVYAAPPPAEPLDAEGQPWDFGGPAAAQYQAVRQALERVQRELDLARSARRFRLR